MRAGNRAVGTAPAIVARAQPVAKRPIPTIPVTEADVINASWADKTAVLSIGAIDATGAAGKADVARTVAVVLRALACTINARTMAAAHTIASTGAYSHTSRPTPALTACTARGTSPVPCCVAVVASAGEGAGAAHAVIGTRRSGASWTGDVAQSTAPPILAHTSTSAIYSIVAC